MFRMYYGYHVVTKSKRKRAAYFGLQNCIGSNYLYIKQLYYKSGCHEVIDEAGIPIKNTIDNKEG